jgi:predicted amidohydrolase
MPRTLRIAAAQYPLDALPSLAAYREKIARWVEGAAAQGAELLLFPEYGAMELATLHDGGGDLDADIDAVTHLIPEMDAIHAALAIRYGVTIVGGSFLERTAAGIVNAGHIFGPSGVKGRFEKSVPTPWERTDAKVAPGGPIGLFDIGKTRIGIAICYDIEFPLIGRAFAEAGAEIILVPSNTEAESGYWRVRIGALARALENQIYTVQSSVVGVQPAVAASSENVGAAGVFGPPDHGLPSDGVLALGAMNRPDWLIASLDLDLLQRVRAEGAVRNFADWPMQPALPSPPALPCIDLTAAG